MSTFWPIMRKQGQRWFLQFIVGLMITVAALSAMVPLWGPALGDWLDVPPHVSHTDAIVVLGGGYPERIEHGINLYQQGLAPEIWLTGDVPVLNAAENDAQEGARLAEEQGIPDTVLFMLASTSTWEDGAAVINLAQQRKLHSILVVTSWYHSRRALCTFKHQASYTGIAIYNDLAPFDYDLPNRWWNNGAIYDVFSELLKSCYYWIRYGVNPWCS